MPCSQALPTPQEHPGPGEGESCPARGATFQQLPSLPEQPVAAQRCPQQFGAGGCKPPLWQGREPQLSQAGRREDPAQEREGGGVAGGDVPGAVVQPRQSPTGILGHAQSGFVQPRDLAVSPRNCSDSAVDIQGSAGAGLSPTAHSCLTIVESSNCREEFFLVDLYDFLWRAMVLWALCFFTHLF